MTRITQVFDNASSLQTAGSAYRQDMFHIPSASLALRTEATLAPQYGLTYNTLGCIVGRLYPLILHKRPQILPMFENVTALATHPGCRQTLHQLQAAIQHVFEVRAFCVEMSAIAACRHEPSFAV